MKKQQPPKIFLKFFRWFCHPKLKDSIEGDLMELYEERIRKIGKRKADLRFISDVLLLFRPSIIKPAEGYQSLNTYGMYKSYLLIGWRNLINNKGYSLINIAGLSVGITVFLLVLLYLNYERSYDQWDSALDQVYRVVVSEQNDDGIQNSPSVQYPLGTFLSETCAEVQQISRTRIPYGESIINVNEEAYFENKVIFADSNFFKLFPYKFKSGERLIALNQPNSAVITREKSKKWFGDENPIGKTIEYNTRELYTIRGVIEKQGPSHLDFDICLSYHSDHFATNWFMRNHDTYVNLNPHANIESLQQKASAIYATHYANSFTDGSAGPKIDTDDPVQWMAEKRGITNMRVLFEPVKKIHLNPIGYMKWSSGVKVYDFDLANALPVIVFTLVGIMIVLLACVNYTNMAIALGVKRARESGIRKIMGASRSQIIRQQMLEAFLVTVISTVISIALTFGILPLLNSRFDLHLSFWSSLAPTQNSIIILQVLLLVIAVTLIASFYPAFILANYQPIKAVKGDITKTSKGKWFRNGLITFQYSMACGFLICIFIISRQLNFIQKNDPGFDTEQVLRIEQKTLMLFPGQPGDRSEYIIDHLQQLPGVIRVTTGENYPGMRDRGVQLVSYDHDQSLPIQFSLVNYDYFEVLGMQISSGRDFSKSHSRDILDAAVINETAAMKMGWDNPVGKTLKLMGKEYTIIGTVKDSHLSGYENQVLPQIYMMGVDEPDNFEGHRQVLIKFEKQQARTGMESAIAYWKTLEPDFPVKYSWLDQDFAILMKKYERFGELTGLLGIVSVLIAVMGVFALSTITAKQRIKEIGIRKVLGASIANVVNILSSDFLKMAILSIILVTPLSAWAMNKWLQSFAYKIELVWWMFFFPGILAVAIAMITVSIQAIKVALTNPVNSIRTE